MCADFGVDVLTVPEPRINNHSKLMFLRRVMGDRILAAMRPVTYNKHGQRAPAHGGVAAINFAYHSRRVRTHIGRINNKGVLTHTIQARGFKPIAIIAAYLPGPQSPQRHWVDELVEHIITEHRRMSERYGSNSVFISLDANRRLHRYKGRFTIDSANDGSKAAQPDRILARLCDVLQVSPLHGRTAATTAHITSRNIDSSKQKHDEDGTEVDYILGANSLAPSDFTVFDAAPWSSDTNITHRLIGARIRLVPAGVNNSNSNNSSNCDSANPSHSEGSSRPVRPPVRQPVIRPPDYDDPRHFAAQQLLMSRLESDAVRSAILSPASSASAAIQALESVLLQVQATAWPAPNAETAERDALHADPIAKAAQQRRHEQSGHVRAYHAYRGRPVPQHAVAMAQAAKGAKKEYRKLRKAGEHVKADAQRSVWKMQQRAFQRTARTSYRQWHGRVIRVLEHRRTHNAASLFDILRPMQPNDPCLFNGDDGGDIPDGDGPSPSPLARFSEFAAQLFGGGDASCGPRAPLAGVTSTLPEWQPFIPRADEPLLAAGFTADELYPIVFPQHKSIAPSPTRCPGGVPSCRCCLIEAASFQLWDGDPDNTDSQPVFGPVMHTATAPGPDGIYAEVLRFSRNEDCSKRLEERLRVCGLLAAIFNKVMAEGRFPDPACVNRSVALFKDGDRSDPNDYRFLTIGNLVQKLWSLAVTRRVTHWAVGRGVLSLSQVAFIPAHGCEEHVFVLQEAVRAQWRAKRGMYALYIDLRKAYDSVRPDALFPLLRMMGIPDSLIRVLEARSASRITRLRVNGDDSDPIRMVDGVGQGDPLSCILFNLFIEPLGRYVASLRGFAGVDIDGVNVKELKFADDIVNPSRSAAELQLVLDATQRWCADWGMQIGLKKTQAMYFPRPRDKSAPPVLPQLHVNGSPIAWVDRYRYLGHWMFSDLRVWGPRDADGKLTDGQAFLDELAARCQLGYAKTVESHSLIRKAPPALTLQLFRTSVAGSANYLLSLTEPSKDACKLLDRLSLKVAREALRLHHHCPNTLAWAESRLMPAVGAMARERSRFLLRLQLSPFDSIARRVYRALAPQWQLKKRQSRARSWVWRMLDLQASYVEAGVAAPAVTSCGAKANPLAFDCGCRGHYPVPAQAAAARTTTPMHRASDALVIYATGAEQYRMYVDVKRAAGVYARSVALHEWDAMARRKQPAKDGVAVAPALELITSSARPSALPATQHAADLHLRHQQLACPTTVGIVKTSTPLSIRGPGCSGAIIALVTRQIAPQHLHALGMLRQGRSAMYHYPLAAKGRLLTDAARDGDANKTASLKRWAHSAHHMASCGLCGSEAEDPFHVITECAHADVSAVRESICAALPAKIQNICVRAMEACNSSGSSARERQGRIDLLGAVEQQLAGVDWASSEGRFILFRFLAVLTWPASAAASDHPAVAALGSLFDAAVAKTHRLRPMANAWVTFAGAAVMRLFGAWNSALPAASAARGGAAAERLPYSAAPGASSPADDIEDDPVDVGYDVDTDIDDIDDATSVGTSDTD